MNRYTFQSRPKELQDTDVRVTTELSKENSRSLEEILSLDPDTSAAFKEIKRKIYPICSSLPLLIYNIPEVIKVTLKNISQCPHSVFQILQALAREVRQELSQSISDIIKSLITLSEINELLEEIFSCISICLKYTIKTLDCKETLFTAIPFISHKDAGIRHLASQSFSFVIKKDLSLLKDILEKIGENAWELTKFSVTNFNVKEVLQCSWANSDAARLMHLALAQEKKYTEDLWESITESNRFTVLRDWAIICNGNTFPKELLEKTIDICKISNIPLILANIIKYHEEYLKELEYILQQSDSFESLMLISDYKDDHIEQDIHEKLLHRRYKNRVSKLDLTSFSEEIFMIIDKCLKFDNAPEALKLLIHCIEYHQIIPKQLKNLKDFLKSCNDNQLIWLGLRISRIIENRDIPSLLVEDEYICREIAAINTLPSTIYGEILWSAAEKYQNGMENSERFIEYLTHPSLRIPATCLLQSANQAMKIAWDIAKEPTTLENERQKITNLKRIDHYYEEFPRAACLFLIGMFWERFSTLWKHVILCLAELGKKFPEILWAELSKIMENMPKEPEYPELYIKYSHIRDWAPSEYVLNNVIEALIACPNIINLHVSEFSLIFLSFFNEEYLLSTWLPFFPIKSEYPSNKPVQKLILFLKVFSAAKSLEEIPNKERLKIIFTSLCTEKNEEIRSLAAEALINMKGEEFLIRDFIRTLSKDETFRDTILIKQSTAVETIIALCGSRAFSKSPQRISAFRYISNLNQGSYLLNLLPIQLFPEHADKLFEIPYQISISFLMNLRNIIKYSLGIIENKDAAAYFLINVYEKSRDGNREIMNKAISCFNILLTKHTVSIQIINQLLSLLSSVFETFSYDIRPKFIELLQIIVKLYPELHDKAYLLDPWVLLLLNPKSETIHINKALETLAILPIPSTPLIISSLVHAISIVSLTPNLFEILCKLPVSNLVTELALKILPFCIKKPEIKELLITWLPFCEPSPINELSSLVLKSEEAIPFLALCLPGSDGMILQKLGATRKKGLNIERCYDLQLEALQEIPDIVFMYPKTILYALSHFLISADLGLRTSAGTAMLSFVSVEGIEDALAICIKKSGDEEQIRLVLNVWNKLDTPLSAVDPERSVILNLGHLQVHRRVRAMGNLENIPVYLVKKLLIPLLTFYLLYSSSKQNYQPSFIHTIVTTLGQYSCKLPWRHYYKLVKFYIKSLQIDEAVSTKALASILTNVPTLELSVCQLLKAKALPTLKTRICDKKDPRRPKIRKFVAVAVFKIIQLQQEEERNGELSRLLMTLSRQYKHKEEDTRDSVLKTVIELLKAGCPQDPILREFNHGLEPELFALFATKILPTGMITVTSGSLSVFHHILLEYEQYSSYYYLAKTISPQLLPSLFASTKTLQYIVQGLSENTKVSPEDYISLALSLLSHKEEKNTSKSEENAQKTKEISRKDITFTIQTGAATGSRPKIEIIHKAISAEKVFGIRLLKIGVNRCKNIDSDVMNDCKIAAVECLSVKKDEAVIGALEVLRIVGNGSIIPDVIKVAEKAGEAVIIHSMKTLASLIKSRIDAENAANAILPQVIYALQTPEVQSSALKLLKIFIGYKIMDESIYDAMEDVPRIIIGNPTLANQACALYSQFILMYPLSEKRKNFHIDFLVKNIGTNSIGANDGIIQALKIVLDKFPYEEIKDYCEFLLLSLITAISNEQTEEYIEKYLELAAKTTKFNSSSSIILKIIDWISSNNENLSKSCIRYSIVCLSQGLLSKQILENEALSRILLISPSKLTLSFLVSWNIKYGGLEKDIEQSIIQLLESGNDLSDYLVSTLHNCSIELLTISLKSIENNTFTQGIIGAIGKSTGEIASRRVSAVARKLFGRGIEDLRVIQLLKSLLMIIRNAEYDRVAMMKTLLVFSRSINTEIKEILQDIFKELHIGINQVEFLQQYTSTKDNVKARKDSKKARQKEMFVNDPELAAKLKQKKSKKSRLLKKKKLLKTAPYKRIKTDNLLVNKE